MTNTKNPDKTSKLGCRYYIQDAIPDPTYGVIKMEHLELMDGPLNDYIKSENFIVTNQSGNEVKKPIHSQ